MEVKAENEIKTGNAIVRVHGTANQEAVRAATVQFLKKVREQKKRREKRA